LPTDLSSENDPLRSARILIVEDDEILRTITRTMLERSGAQKVVCAIDGLDALEKLKTFPADLIVLDIAMNNMDGLEFCRILRKENSPLRTVPILVTTGLGKNDKKLRALHIGVSEFLYKPVNQNDLLQKVRIYLEKSRLLQRLQKGEQTSAEDLQKAYRLQNTFLPQASFIKDCETRYGVQILHTYLSSESLGGDYWMVHPLSDGRLMVCVVDFSGHGVSAALNTLRLRTCLIELLNHHQSPAAILTELNELFYPMLPAGEYATCFLGFISPESGSLTYAAAGSPPAIVAQPGTAYMLDCAGTPIGAYAEASYTDRNSLFMKDSMLLMYSDALIEKNTNDETAYTPDTLLQEMRALSLLGAKAVYEGIAAHIARKSHRFDDDLTILLVSQAASGN
jgi:sigma-B regulation protein RsbU (phosphoserine phosphatase)